MSTEIRARSFGELLDAGFEVLTEHFAVLVGLAAIVYLPPALFALALVPASLLPMDGGPASSQLAWTVVGVHTAVSILWVVAAWPLSSAAITHAVGAYSAGEDVRFASALREAARVYVRFVWTTGLSWLAICAGLLLVVPGVLLALGYYVLGPVVVLERVYSMQAMRRSRRLMAGHRLRALVVAVVTGTLVTVPAVALQFALATVPRLGYPVMAVVYAAGFAYTITVTVLLYHDIRCREEAFDLQCLARTVAGGSGVAPELAG